MNAFKRNLLIGYGISIFLLLASSIASFVSIRNLLDSQVRVAHTDEVILKLENLLSVLKDAESGQRGFLITENEQFLEHYKGSAIKSRTLIAEIKTLTVDNPQQQVDCDILSTQVLKRIDYLESLIQIKRNGGEINDSSLLMGKTLMDNARKIATTMEQRENNLLALRTANLNRFASSTPILIIIAAGLGILVTVISFFRVLKDYNTRASLQESLERKDREISRRLLVIEGIANQISSGNYDLQVSDEGNDALGSIAISLNRMGSSLQTSFTDLQNREWMQTGIAQLNEIMIGEKDLTRLAEKVVAFLSAYINAPISVFYFVRPDQTIEPLASHGVSKTRLAREIPFGEGLAGQAAQTGKDTFIEEVPQAQLTLEYAAGVVRPHSLLAIVVRYETILKAVIEFGTLEKATPVVKDFLRTVSFNIGLAIHSARDHQRLQELLNETQAQSEELQTQHSELENVNAELEAQAEKLQASEEELRVQQEELQQANQELEERSRLLEERNELIVERNFEIQKKAEELALSTKYKSEFLANMSHELRTPLNSILLLSRLLSENHERNLSGDQVEYANVIQSSGKGLLTLIDEILDLSKIEAGKMELEYNSISLPDVISELRGLFDPLARDKGISFSVKLDESVPEQIETDRLRLEQIIRNLISNAIKFTRQGSVELFVRKSGDAIAFEVKDTGIGIPADKQQTIFEAFQQADGSTRRQFGGTGLGLSISRELARLLGGEIHLKSEEGKGSSFTLVIPSRKVEGVAHTLEEMPVIEALPAISKEPEKSRDTRYLSESIPAAIPDDRDKVNKGDRVILIIEDDTAFARSLLDYTRKQGYKGVVAVRGDEGIELAGKVHPTGILLDVQLPVKSGWEVMEALKSNPATRPIPVHMMSSHEVKTKSISSGAVDFINKPVAFEKLGEMFNRIEQALKRHPKKVLIVEENPKHAQALAYFLESYEVTAEIKNSIDEGVKALNREDVDCVILDMGIPAQRSYEIFEDVKKTKGLENLPIIVFTGKNLSHIEEMKIRQYADTIVVKTAHSYQRILDEVSLFLHLVEENKTERRSPKYRKMGELGEVLKGKTILIADDDVRNIFSLTKSLENYGMQVISAIDGRDALKQLEQHPETDLVLMDMMMPEMDGYESTAKIRQNIKHRNLPVIAVTAKAMTGDREKCIAAGASDYITKPVDVDQLISLLRVWLYQ